MFISMTIRRSRSSPARNCAAAARERRAATQPSASATITSTDPVQGRNRARLT